MADNCTETPKKAKLVLEDGSVFSGISCGAEGIAYGEIVFNTSMTGYQEILTDPSYKGQIVAMTYPLIGNYGVNPEDVEGRRPFVEGFVMRECARMASNWRSCQDLDAYLRENRIIAISEVDTRALTRHIRIKGELRAVISTEELDDDALIEKAKSSQGLSGVDLVREVTIAKPASWNKAGRYHVVVIDCGVKFNILRVLSENDCRLTLVPASASAEDIMALKPDGIMVSNGPGDPAAVKDVIKNLGLLIKKNLPIFGVCLGQQLIGLALGAKTYKLKFGHHGGNHPVKYLKTGRIDITSQNHGFCLDIESLPKDEVEITHINLNDNTLEGIRHKQLPLFSVQFHPEAGPGPHDARHLFGEFIESMEKNRLKAS